MSAALVDLVNRTALCIGIAAAVYSVTVRTEAPPPELARTPVVEHGIVDDHGQFLATDVVPLEVGQEFGWRLHLDDGAEHTWREVMIAPAPPREWFGDDLIVGGDGTVGVTERTEVPRGGLLSHGWSITEGDPAGPYVIHLFVDGEHVESMRFVLR